MQNSLVHSQYELISTLGRGSEGETYLVRHKTTDVYRVIKKVDRSFLIAIPLEKNLLRSLSHPGLPIIYDIEQDRHFYYFILEYIEGMTLAEYIRYHKKADPIQVLQYGIELCGILEYLHTRLPEPIVHLDLQPRNILICNGQIKLVDFGNAFGLSKASCFSHQQQYFHIRGFETPNMYLSPAFSIQSDLYYLGKLLYYMLTGEVLCDTSGSITSLCFEKLSRKYLPLELGEQLGETICKCLYPTPALYYKDARALKVGLEILLLQFEKAKKQEPTVPVLTKRRKICVCGATAGIGTTHLCLSMTEALNKTTKRAIYVEAHESQMLYRLREEDKLVREKNGIYSYGSCRMTTQENVGTTAALSDPSIQIMDYGVCDFNVARQIKEQADACLLVSGMMYWQTMIFREVLTMLPAGTIYLFNYGDQKLFQQIKRTIGTDNKKCILRLPFIGNPFALDYSTAPFFDELFSILNLK